MLRTLALLALVAIGTLSAQVDHTRPWLPKPNSTDVEPNTAWYTKFTMTGSRDAKYCTDRSTDHGSQVMCDSESAGPWETYHVATARLVDQELKVTFVSGRTGLFCAEEAAGIQCTRKVVPDAEAFTVTVLDRHSVSLKVGDKYCEEKEDRTVKCDKDEETEFSRFHISPVSKL